MEKKVISINNNVTDRQLSVSISDIDVYHSLSLRHSDSLLEIDSDRSLSPSIIQFDLKQLKERTNTK